MNRRAFFFSGVLLSLIVLSFWQKEFLNQLSLAISEQPLISPSTSVFAPEPKVLGDITAIENDFDFGQLLPDSGVLAQGAYAYDLTRNKFIFEKDSQKRLQAASTVKIVTAAVALERGQKEEQMTVNFFPTVVGESSMSLEFGEKFTLDELLYGLLLVSGNDVAETIAQGLGGKREIFVGWMNDFAKKAGAVSTNFTTPSGLDEEGQYTTAYDLFSMGRYVFSRYPEILAISTTREKYLPKNINHRAYLLRNKLLLLNDFPVIIGGKPGLGEQGMLSLVALLEKDGLRILVTIIRTPSIRHDLTQILKLL